ncbi:hypothetical protein KH5_12090 [Urechidicola sp. KH5]
MYTADVDTYSDILVKPDKYIAYFSPIIKGNDTQKEREYEQSFVKKLSPLYISDTYPVIYDGSQGDFNCMSLQEILKSREEDISFFKKKGYEVIVLDEEIESDKIESKVTTTKVFFSSLKISEKTFVDGFVTVKSKFVFFGYPYIVAKFEQFTVTRINHEGASYSQNSNVASKFLPLPYTPKSKPFIDADFWVWTPKIINANSTRKDEYQIFNFPVNKLGSVSDNYENDVIDTYFKNFSHPEKKDAFFWQGSLFQNPNQSTMGTYTLSPINITGISETLATDIKLKLDQYYKDKNYDYWGNKKTKTQKTEEKKDDFWGTKKKNNND